MAEQHSVLWDTMYIARFAGLYIIRGLCCFLTTLLLWTSTFVQNLGQVRPPYKYMPPHIYVKYNYKYKCLCVYAKIYVIFTLA